MESSINLKNAETSKIVLSSSISCYLYMPQQLSPIDIVQILLKGDNDFKPSLQASIDVNQYSEKLSLYAYVLLIYENQNFAGNVFYYVNPQGFVYITHINIYTDYRHKNFGHILIQQIKSLHKTSTRIDLEVRKDNTYAYQFYIREGFVVKENRVEKYLMSLHLC